MPHRPARRRGRLAGETEPAIHPRPRGRGARRGRGRRGRARQGRRQGRHPLVVLGVWPLRTLPGWLGDAVRDAAQHRLLGQRRLRRVRTGRCQLCRPASEGSGLRRDRAGTMRRRDRLHGAEGHRHQAR
ncbi:hypothetical protein G6F46_014871 [Rhizopus delemar]|nr:hypothetical protein G6F46_014871 [Rhizopus delemar]